MAFHASRAAYPLVTALVLGCSVDERTPRVGMDPVETQCEPEQDAPRCDDDFVQRCDASGAWQRDAVPCELGCRQGVCIEPGMMLGDENPQSPFCGNDGDGCDDGLFCTVEDACQAGECRGTPRDCDDTVACTAGDTCDEDGDRCVPGAVQCPGGQFCDAESGECASSCSGCVVDAVCHPDGASNPVNPCEVCDAAASSAGFSAAPSTVSCDDGVACTELDVCTNGTCSGATLACAADQRCSESSGQCEPIVAGCSEPGQLACVDGDVHECSASLLSSRLVRACDVACDPGAAPASCVGGFSLVLELARTEVTQGSSAEVSLTLVRADDHALPVDITVLGLPPGVNAGALGLAGNQDLATLTLGAEARAPEGVSTPLTVRASDGLSVVDQPLELFVRGEPGSLDLSFGSNGTERAEPPGAPGFQGTRVAVDGADRILVAATSRFVLDPLGVPARASLTRFGPGGAVDTNFASGGTYLETPGSSSLGEGPSTFLGDVALASDGYVLAGPLGEGVVQEASFLTRLNGAGSRAPGFAAPTLGGGLRLVDVAAENGAIFATGESLSNAAIYRSALDGSGGQRFVESSILSGMRTVFWSAADNDFILAGNCDPNACFARFNPDRVPPQIAPTRLTNVAPSSASIVDAVADAQGRYFAIASGWSLVRFLPEVVRPPGAQAFSVVVDSLSSGGRSPQGIEHDGDRLYVAAALPDPSGEAGIPAVVRYSTTWSRDTTFAAAGLSELDGVVDVGSSVDVDVQSDGRVIVATVSEGRIVVYRVWD